MSHTTRRLTRAVAAGAVLAAAAGTTLATDNLIGFNWTTSSSTTPDPLNWNRISSADGTLFNVLDDTGVSTPVGINFGGGASGGFVYLSTSTLDADAVPQHSYDLSGMTGYGFRSNGEFFVEITGLDANTPYEYWFVAYRTTSAIDQAVSVSDGDTINAFTFPQSKPSGTARFVINDQLSNDTQVWDDLSFETTSSSTGTITFNWEGVTQTTVIGALAVRRAVPPEPFDVRILGSANPSDIGINDNTTLTFNVVNPSPADVTGVVVDIELPAGLDYVSDDRSGTLVGNVLTASLGDLIAGDTTTINVVANASAPGDFLVTGEVDINEVDPNLDNNIVMVPVGVGETDLGVAMTADANPVVIDGNGEVNFTIDYENFGPVGAADVQVVFTAPPELNITGTSAGTIVGSTVTLDLASFPAFNTGSFTVNTTATAPNTNAVASVEISHAGPDPDPSNDTAEISLLIVQSAADFPAIDTIFTNVESLDNSNVPGRPGFKFRNTATGTLTTAFSRPYASPNGDLWILRAEADADLAQRQLILVGAETQGTTVLQRGDLDPAQPPFGFNAIGIIDEAMSINDSGSWVARTRDDDSPTQHFILKFDSPTAEFSKPAKTGDPVPGIPGAEYGNVMNSANITNTGEVGLIATSLDGVPTSENAAVIFGNQVLAQQGVTAPNANPDLMIDASNTWNFPTSNTFEVSGDGSSYIFRSTINNSATSENSVTAVNNEAVLRQGFDIPGDTILNSSANTPNNQVMNGNGDWMVRGPVASGDRYVVFNGEVVAWTGGPTGLPDNSTWGGFTQTFRAMASNANGDFVIGGQTDDADPSRNEFFVLYCANGSVVELMRAGDPVDLSGNGQFDNSAFLDQWQNDRVFMNNTHVYFVAQVRDTFDGSNRFGQGFFRVELPDCGDPPCPADLNGDGVVDADDFFLFLQWFADADPRADINNDGVIDADDFFDYLSLFAAGC